MEKLAPLIRVLNFIILLFMFGCGVKTPNVNITIDGYFTLSDSSKLKSLLNVDVNQLELNDKYWAIYTVSITNNYNNSIFILISDDNLMYAPLTIKNYQNDSLISTGIVENFGYKKHEILFKTTKDFVLKIGNPEISEKIIFKFEYFYSEKNYEVNVECDITDGKILDCNYSPIY